MTDRPPSNGRTALVTGASSGIGAELSKQIASDGYDVVLTARRKERLRTLADELEDDHGIRATVVPKDLSETSAPRELFDEIRQTHGFVHTLVNNAGFPVYGHFDGTDIAAEQDMIQVNVSALTHLTKLFVRPMIERGEGGIINTGSTAGYYPSPTAAVYGATKAYVNSFTRAMAHELADEEVTISLLCPGAVETEFMERKGMAASGADEGVTNDPASVAKAAWEQHKAGERIIWPSKTAALAVQFPRLLPHKTVTSLGEGGFEDGTLPFLSR